MNGTPSKILIIQTAFIGDVILTTSLVEKLKDKFPEVNIDFLVRKGSETLLKNNPKLNKIWVLNKRQKYREAFRLIGFFRKEKYDLLINAQRHFTTGLITALSGAKYKIGFSSNPLSGFFDKKIPFHIEKDIDTHEIDRLHGLISEITDNISGVPRLYPGVEAEESINNLIGKDFITIHPGSVWQTKQLPESKWIELVGKISKEYVVYLLGGPGERDLCERIKESIKGTNVINKAGEVNLIETAALMKHAFLNYVNDSAPLHICTAMDAPCLAVFCSTIPEFGFYPKTSRSKIVQINENLYCRPCGVHGKKKCPEGHFKCGNEISVEEMLPENF